MGVCWQSVGSKGLGKFGDRFKKVQVTWRRGVESCRQGARVRAEERESNDTGEGQGFQNEARRGSVSQRFLTFQSYDVQEEI